MTVRVRQYKRGGWEVDIQFRWPEDMTVFRRRLRAPVDGKSVALRWGEAREAAFLRAGKAALKPPEKKEVPTLAEFQHRFIEGYAKANRQKASTIHTKELILAKLLVPKLGNKRLDEITNEDVQRLKGELSSLNPKTVNNKLNILSVLLHVAVDWGVIDRMPCTIKLLKVVHRDMAFYEVDQFTRLVDAARKIDPRVVAMVLLGGDAGLRRGEIVALRQTDVDHRRRQVHVQRSVWRTIEDSPKGGRGRIVPLTNALAAALGEVRHLRGPRVLYLDDGGPVDDNVLQDWMERVTRRAGLEPTRSLHILRHTFCSHLAMKGAPAKAIQELAGHQSLHTTLRYMHLSPAAREGAIRLLDARGDGEVLETGLETTPISESNQKRSS